MLKKVVISSSLLILPLLSACGSIQNTSAPSREALKNGSIVIARPIPDVQQGPVAMLGFMPSSQNRLGNWISIDRSTGTLTLRENDASLLSLKISDGIDSLKPGVFTVVHKQKQPLWYARDSYFTSRGLEVPAEGSKERFRKGALGEYALYLTPEFPIHAGPVWSTDVGGLRVSEEALSRLYFQLDVGVPVEVK